MGSTGAVYGGIVGGTIGLLTGWLPAGAVSALVTFGHFTGFWTFTLALWASIALFGAAAGAGVGYVVGRLGDD